MGGAQEDTTLLADGETECGNFWAREEECEDEEAEEGQH